MNPNELLFEISAATAALWWPTDPTPPNLYALRKAVAGRGNVCVLDFLHEPERRRALGELIDLEAVIVDGGGGVSAMVIAATPYALDAIRGDVSLGQFHHAETYLVELHNLAKGRNPQAWQSEHDLAAADADLKKSKKKQWETENGRALISGLRELITPVIECGFVEFRNRLLGGIDYRLTKAGVEAAHNLLLHNYPAGVDITLPNPNPVLRAEWIRLAEQFQADYAAGRRLPRK